MLHGRGCARTSMGQHVQKLSVQRQAHAAGCTPPYHSRLLRHTLCGQQANDDPREDGYPPAFRSADPQRFLRSTRGTGNGAWIRLSRNGAGPRPVRHTLHTSNPAERRSISTFRHRKHRATQRRESKTEASTQHVRATKRHRDGGSCSEGRIPRCGTRPAHDSGGVKPKPRHLQLSALPTCLGGSELQQSLRIADNMSFRLLCQCGSNFVFVFSLKSATWPTDGPVILFGNGCRQLLWRR